jgi:hypothetical protein
MKKHFLILITLCSLNILAQKRSEIFFKDYVECYYSDKETESIFIYDEPNGKVITELDVLTESNCWYKFAISDSNNGWLKIENVIVLPACKESELNNDIGKYNGKWISSKKMKISLPDIPQESGIKMNFYENPNENSNIIFTALEHLSTELIDVNGTWAKVKFKKDGKLYIGWLERKYQCPYPWTTCPVSN